MADLYGHPQAALIVLTAASAPHNGLQLAGRHRYRIVPIDFFFMNGWKPATARATHRQEVVCQLPQSALDCLNRRNSPRA